MDKLWISRRNHHLKRQSKYLQRVFNDHFVLVLLVMFGAALYAYSQFVKGLNGHGNFWLIAAVSLVLAGTLPLGRLVTLAERADAVFLLPQLGRMRAYLRGAFTYSLALPLTLQVLITLAAWPLMRGGAAVPPLWVMLQLLAQLCFKLSDMALQEIGCYWTRLKVKNTRYLLVAVAFVVTLAGLCLTPVVTLGVAVLLSVFAISTRNRVLVRENINLDEIVQNETARQARIYRFYNLFTDVPGLGGGVARRQYMDWALTHIARTRKNTWLFLYARGLVRSDEYFGLTLRLAVVGAVLILISSEWWLGFLIGLGTLYLLDIQLAPFIKRYDEIVFTHLFPVARTERVGAWQTTVAVATLVCAAILSIAAIGRFGVWGILTSVLLILSSQLIPRVFMVARIRKNR